MWYNIIGAICAILALIISLLSLRHSKDTQKSQELKEKFSDLESELYEYKKKLDTLSVLEERINNEIIISEKYRNRFDEKLDEIIRIIYAQK